ncbi:phosphoglycerate mutase [Aureimonas sp. SA4125]|uniref:SixA phosphatase family protein n=1 Tax=Aureimonas sp. SA4125 TaxID=2826993 RepID=UPI001CC557D3|nr:histidine phosphatase family protein [Aureimonas sp. SA4125]BDA85088.1 phosphoglycerate mutase [Aureimonas sp. SA4125]
MVTAPISTLYLLRHAHAAVPLPGQGDRDRPLDARGARDAPRIGDMVAEEISGLSSILCSPAVRTRQTLDALRPHLAENVSIAFRDSLYEHGLDAYLAEVRKCEAARGVLVIGHNPTIEEFALQLVGDGDAKAMALLREGLPTMALAIISFDTGISQIAPGSGFLRRLLRPRDLAA